VENERINSLHERVVITESVAKSAHYRLDRLEVDINELKDIKIQMALNTQALKNYLATTDNIVMRLSSIEDNPKNFVKTAQVAAIIAVVTGVVGVIIGILTK
jgi:hypothetical protein